MGNESSPAQYKWTQYVSFYSALLHLSADRCRSDIWRYHNCLWDSWNFSWRLCSRFHEFNYSQCFQGKNCFNFFLLLWAIYHFRWAKLFLRSAYINGLPQKGKFFVVKESNRVLNLYLFKRKKQRKNFELVYSCTWFCCLKVQSVTVCTSYFAFKNFFWEVTCKINKPSDFKGIMGKWMRKHYSVYVYINLPCKPQHLMYNFLF